MMKTFKAASILTALLFALLFSHAVFAQIVAVEPVQDFGQKIAGWQKTVEEVETKFAAGPVDPVSITESKDRLKNLRTVMAEEMKAGEGALKTQNDLLTALGPVPEKDTGIKEDKDVQKKRGEITAEISKIDAQVKQVSLLIARVDKLSESIGKQKTDIRKTEILQKSGYLLTPAALKAATIEAREYFPAVKFSAAAGSYWFAAIIVFWLFYRSMARMKVWASQRQVFKAKPRNGALYLQLLFLSTLLLADRLDLFGLSAAPVLGDLFRLAFASWLAAGLFVFLSGLSFELPEGMDEEETGMPVGFLNFLLTIMKIVALLLIPAAVLGYVQLAAYLALNMAGSIAGILLFVAMRSGLIAVSARLAKTFGVERVLSPLAIAFFEPIIAAAALLFAASFWGVTPADVRDWADKLSGGITIGSIKLDFSDAGAAAAVFFGLYILTKSIQLFLSKRLFPQTHMDRGVQDAVHTLIGYTGISIALLTALSTLGLDMAKLAIVAGALSVGIGFGLQAVVNNFVSGLILLFERPIRVGDIIKVGTEQGMVKKIRVRSTELETLQSGSIIVPNSKLIADNVTNWTLEGRGTRVEIFVTVAHGTEADLVKKLMLSAATEHQLVRKRPEPVVFFTNFLATGMEFELRCFIRDIADKGGVASDLRFAIDRAFREHDIKRA